MNKHVHTTHVLPVMFVFFEGSSTMLIIKRQTDNHWNNFNLFWEVVTQTHHRMAATLCDWHWLWMHRDCSGEFQSHSPLPSCNITTLISIYWGRQVSKSVTIKVLFSLNQELATEQKIPWIIVFTNKQTNKQTLMAGDWIDGIDCKHISIQNDQLRLHSIIQADSNC